MGNDLQEILGELEARGWRIERATKHYKAFPPNKAARFVTIQTTPSGPRWRHNLVAQIRRSDPGFRREQKEAKKKKE
jgi:hypothetical protein